MKITTNNHWYDFKYGTDLTTSQLRDIMDCMNWPREYAMSYYGYITCYGMVFSLDEFMRLEREDIPWDGIYNLTFDSGVIVQISPDGEQYKAGFITG